MKFYYSSIIGYWIAENNVILKFSIIGLTNEGILKKMGNKKAVCRAEQVQLLDILDSFGKSRSSLPSRLRFLSYLFLNMALCSMLDLSR